MGLELFDELICDWRAAAFAATAVSGGKFCRLLFCSGFTSQRLKKICVKRDTMIAKSGSKLICVTMCRKKKCTMCTNAVSVRCGRTRRQKFPPHPLHRGGRNCRHNHNSIETRHSRLMNNIVANISVIKRARQRQDADRINQVGYYAGKRRCDSSIYQGLAFEKLLTQQCTAVRKGSGPCPNKKECRSAFGGIPGLIESVTLFRQSLWSGVLSRGNELRKLIGSLSTPSAVDGFKTINFCISGRPVCKHFFRECTGFRRQLFDEIVACAEGRLEVERPHRLHGSDALAAAGMTRRQAGVLAFFEKFFTKERVEHDPGTGNLLTIKSSMKDAYDSEYVPHCAAAKTEPLGYGTFTAVRRQFFPHLKIHKAYKRKSGWNHTACVICTEMSSTMKHCKDPETYALAFSKLTDHIQSLDACRMHYGCVETKAVMTNQWFGRFKVNMSDLSLVQDASGGHGTTYHPHCASFSAQERPQKKDLLKVKCTFSKLHGHGTYIYVSICPVERSGANLSLEIIYNSIYKYLESLPPGHILRYHLSCVIFIRS